MRYYEGLQKEKAESTGQNISEDDSVQQKVETKAEEKKVVDSNRDLSPITGVAADLSTAPDEAFAEE